MTIAGAATYREVEHHAGAQTVPGLIVYRFDAPVFFARHAPPGRPPRRPR